MSPTPPPTQAVDLTTALVAIDSVNPGLTEGAAGEAELAAFIGARLEASGFIVRTLVDTTDHRRVSVIAEYTGTRSGRTIVLNGHLDTVGVEGMPDPFSARIEGDRLYGRGTSDMKGGVAGLIVAAEHLAATDAPGKVIVALVADEEDASLGAEAVIADLSARSMRPNLCLIAEPTWLDLAIAHRGYSVVEVTLHGRAAHSSQPGEGVDAIRGLNRLLTEVENADGALRAGAQHPLLGAGTLMATVVRAGTAPFSVAAQAEVVIERRTVPGESPADALAEVRVLLERVTAAVPGLTADARLRLTRDAWEQDETGAAAEFAGLLGDALEKAGTPNARRTGAPYWMESALWQAAGVPTVVCGPAGGGLHAIDEWVDASQLEHFAHAVADAARRFLEATP
ncbi:M20/M25/M40 family metallo-hydrolase [Microbacterium lacus]|uniref:M20/M25/M40 family metallo-hydrolase n=1 Tax=Microbacterium lacus TaxID=415217 RepID=UPI0038514AF7